MIPVKCFGLRWALRGLICLDINIVLHGYFSFWLHGMGFDDRENVCKVYRSTFMYSTDRY